MLSMQIWCVDLIESSVRIWWQYIVITSPLLGKQISWKQWQLKVGVSFSTRMANTLDVSRDPDAFTHRRETCGYALITMVRAARSQHGLCNEKSHGNNRKTWVTSLHFVLYKVVFICFCLMLGVSRVLKCKCNFYHKLYRCIFDFKTLW